MPPLAGPYVTRLVPPLILLAAVWLRAHNLAWIEHNVDHAYPIWQALTTLEQGRLPLLAQGTSVLFANPPLTGYLYVLPVALTRSPLGPYWLVIGLNSLAVWFTWRLGARMLGPAAGLVSAGLMAVNPWVIEYSRATWVQSLIPFGVCLLLWLLAPVMLGMTARPARRTLAALLVLTALTQTYLLAYVLVAPVAGLLILFRKRVPSRAAAAGTLIFALATALYGQGLLADRPATSAHLEAYRRGQAALSAEAWWHAVRLVTGAGYTEARGGLLPPADVARGQSLGDLAGAAGFGALLVGLGLAAWQIGRRGDRRPVAIILLIWFGLPVLLMSYVAWPVHPFYQLFGLPAGALLAGWGAIWLGRWRALRPALAVAGLACAGVLAGGSLRYAEETARFPGAHGLGALPLGIGLQLGERIRALRPPDGVVFADVDGWTLNSLSGTLYPTSRATRNPNLLILPAGGALYTLFDEPAPVTGEPTETLGPFADGTSLRLYRLPAFDAASVPHPLFAASDRGISLLGYGLDGQAEPGQPVVLTTYWRVEALPAGAPDGLFGPFAHVFDASEGRVLIVDGAVVPGDEWRPGDAHVQRMSFSLPAEARAPFRFQVGQFDGVHGLNALFSLPEGGVAPAVTLPANDLEARDEFRLPRTRAG